MDNERRQLTDIDRQIDQVLLQYSDPFKELFDR
jgi:hypothetical protein